MRLPPKKYSVVDISRYESVSDINVIKVSGVEGAIIKCLDGYRHPTATVNPHVDPLFHSHWSDFKDFPMRGLYTYARFNDSQLKRWGYPTSMEQVDLTYATVKGLLQPEDVVSWDVEQPPAEFEQDVPEWKKFYWIAQKCMTTVDYAKEVFNRDILLYSYEDYFFNMVVHGPPEFKNWVTKQYVWLAQYPTIRLHRQLTEIDFQKRIVLHQYTDDGLMPGFIGEVDKNTELVYFEYWKSMRGGSVSALRGKRYGYRPILKRLLGTRNSEAGHPQPR